MPNPYHDSLGRFASKAEMGAEVESLRDAAINGATPEARAVAADRWMQLQREYDALTEDTVTVSKEWLARSASSGSMTIPNDPATMQAYYDGIREQMHAATTDHSDDHVLASKAKELLKRPNLPEDIRADIYANASDAVKARLVREMGYRDSEGYFTAADVMALVPKEGPIGPELGEEISGLSGSNAFTYEQRFDIAKRSGNIPYLVSYGTPNAVFESRESEEALVQELSKVSTFKAADAAATQEEIDKAMTQRRAWAALAARTRSPKTQATILAVYGKDDDLSERHVQAEIYNNPAATLLRENEHVDQAQVKQLFKDLAANDVVKFDKLADAYIKGNADTSLNYVMRRQNTLMDVLPNRYYKEPGPVEAAALQMTALSLRSTPSQRVNAQAKLDAMPANLKGLKREFSQAKKAQHRKPYDAQANERYAELSTRKLNAERALFANKTMNYWQSEYPADAAKS